MMTLSTANYIGIKQDNNSEFFQLPGQRLSIINPEVEITFKFSLDPANPQKLYNDEKKLNSYLRLELTDDLMRSTIDS